MTVQQLIDQLEKVEDKNMRIAVWNSTGTGWTRRFDAYTDVDEMWDSTGKDKTKSLCLNIITY